MPSLPLPALIFDFDGTLIESAPELASCLNAMLAEDDRGPLTQAQVEDMIGNGVAKLVERGLRASGGVPGNLDEYVKRFMAIYDAAPITDTPVYEGVAETLERLGADGHMMAICTNKPYAPTIKILEGIGMTHHFSVVAGGDSFPVRKPDPGHLEGVLDLLGIGRDQAISQGAVMHVGPYINLVSPNDPKCKDNFYSSNDIYGQSQYWWQKYELDEAAAEARDPAGGVMASAVDMAHFAKTLLDSYHGQSGILSPQGIRDLWKSTQDLGCGTSCPWQRYYAVGFFTDTASGPVNEVEHGGVRAGFSSVFVIRPEKKLAISILANGNVTSLVALDQLAKTILNGF